MAINGSDELEPNWRDEFGRYASDELKQLHAKLYALEIEAGIDAATKEAARERPSDEDAGAEPDNVSYARRARRHREHLYKHLRARIRDLYFSVSDSELRSKLITTQRQIELVELELADHEVDRYRFLLDREEKKLKKSPWLMSALFGMLFVAAGYSGFGVVGALCAAVFGIFHGEETIRRYTANARDEIASRRRTWKEEKLKADTVLKNLQCFQKEEESGIRDTTFDDAAWLVAWRRDEIRIADED
jgi:hypothetical protein